MFIIIIACLTCHTIMLCLNVILSCFEHSKQYRFIHLLFCLTLNLLAYAICVKNEHQFGQRSLYLKRLCVTNRVVCFHICSQSNVSFETTSALWLLYIAFGYSRRLYIIIATVADNHIIIWYKHKYNAHLFR